MLVTIWAKLQALKAYILKEAKPFVPTLVACDACYSQIDERASICKFCHFPHAAKK